MCRSWLALAATLAVVMSLPAHGQSILGKDDTLFVANAILSSDGFSRSTVAVNGIHPGPLIIGQKDDTFRLNVVNNLTDPTMRRSTSVHWHGLLQRGTNWADGAEGVNQCPISPGHSFLYQFSPAGHAGTFWYHSHFGEQYCDGLRGPMVVYDAQDPYRSQYDVDDANTVITLADWFHKPAASIQGPLRPDATLINGIGRTPGGQQVPLAVVNVEAGKKYRFRLVSLACDANFLFSIDQHKLRIIEADGQLTQALDVDSLRIFTGQRYSFILNANQPIGNYRIRSIPNLGVAGLTGTVNGGVNSAILRYATAPNAEPDSSPVANGVELREVDLRAYGAPGSNPSAPGIPQPGLADVNLRFKLEFAGGRFRINGTSYVGPDVPTLLQIMSGAQTAADLLPVNSVYALPRNKVIELVVPSDGVAGGPHPFHLHGHAFSVVRSAGSSTYNFANPVRRDVVSIGGNGDQVTIRFVTDNPGPWFFHCHIEPHLVSGLAIVFAEDMESTVASNPVPAAWNDLCRIYDELPDSEKAVTIVRRNDPISAKFMR